MAAIVQVRVVDGLVGGAHGAPGEAAGLRAAIHLLRVEGGDDPLAPGSTEEATVEPEPPAARTHTVAEGETCGGIAALYNISVDTLLAANPRINEDCTNLHVDEVLNIPAPDPAATPSPSDDTSPAQEGTIYIVVPGDTCAAIAQDHDIALPTFLAANGLDEEACLTLQVGQEVVIPE